MPKKNSNANLMDEEKNLDKSKQNPEQIKEVPEPQEEIQDDLEESLDLETDIEREKNLQWEKIVEFLCNLKDDGQLTDEIQTDLIDRALTRDPKLHTLWLAANQREESFIELMQSHIYKKKDKSSNDKKNDHNITSKCSKNNSPKEYQRKKTVIQSKNRPKKRSALLNYTPSNKKPYTLPNTGFHNKSYKNRRSHINSHGREARKRISPANMLYGQMRGVPTSAGASIRGTGGGEKIMNVSPLRAKYSFPNAAQSHMRASPIIGAGVSQRKAQMMMQANRLAAMRQGRMWIAPSGPNVRYLSRNG